MPIASVKTYYDQINGLLDTADTQHDQSQVATLGAVVDNRRGDWQAVADTSIEPVASELVTVLGEADANLEPGQVQELEKHVQKRVAKAR